MTYCVGILTKEGIICASDSRTNAGVDHIATVCKMTRFEIPGEREILLLSARNLATTQAVVSMVNERLEIGTEETSLLKVPTMFNAARIVGEALREVIKTDGPHVRAEQADPSASFILAGQISGRPVRLFQIYSAGNFMEASAATPFVQIGETKYGKPILDRIVSYDMPLDRAAKAALVSFDATMRSNISVGLPINLAVYRADSYILDQNLTLTDDNDYFATIRRRYSAGLLRLFDRLPDPDFDTIC